SGGSAFFRRVFGKPFTFHRYLSCCRSGSARSAEDIESPCARRVRRLERMPEKRKAKRRQIGQRVWVDFGPGSSVQPCLLKDMSDAGAGLILLVREPAPYEFTLQFAPDGSVGRRCQLRWQRGSDIGVKFVARVLNRRRPEAGLPDSFLPG